MMKLRGAFISVIMVLAIFSLSGCGGGSSSSQTEEEEPSYGVKQAMMLSSPALEVNKRYRIYVSPDLSGMDGNRYYIANIGSSSTQAALNLGFSIEIGSGHTLAVVDDSTSGVVFAYDPEAVRNGVKNGGSVSFSGGKILRYRSLNISADIDGGSANLIDYATSTDVGTTTVKMGTGAGQGFFLQDELYYESRDIPSSGEVYRLVRKVNTFSGIITVGR